MRGDWLGNWGLEGDWAQAWGVAGAAFERPQRGERCIGVCQ